MVKKIKTAVQQKKDRKAKFAMFFITSNLIPSWDEPLINVVRVLDKRCMNTGRRRRSSVFLKKRNN